MEEPSDKPDEKPEEPLRPLFPHPQWMVGVVLIIAVLCILAGIKDPIWFLLGLPFIIVLALFLYVRLIKRKSPQD
jgi:L-asparagine transporter-like permease